MYHVKKIVNGNSDCHLLTLNCLMSNLQVSILVSLRHQNLHHKHISVIGIKSGLQNPHQANHLRWNPCLHESKVSHIVIVFHAAISLLWVMGQDWVQGMAWNRWWNWWKSWLWELQMDDCNWFLWSSCSLSARLVISTSCSVDVLLYWKPYQYLVLTPFLFYSRI